ncbi:MAG: cytochrome c oxidase subunit [Acidimicrobiaceae bacterium]|nr:cytochrome c oxidase subunit [Acidimicrobiaceae bacterium]
MVLPHNRHGHLSVFKRVVDAVEYLALACALVFVVLLFADRPGASKTSAGVQVSVGSSSAPPEAGAAASAAAGAPIYAANCSTCHGSSGEGSIGPKLRGGAVTQRYPDPAAEIAIVTNGEDGMPGWRTRLSAADIEAVVAYTRTGLR